MNRRKKSIVLVAILLAVIMLGVGYAVINGVDLEIGGTATSGTNQDNFRVGFSGAVITSKSNNDITATAAVDNSDSTKATFSVSGLTTAGDNVVATYTVKNLSTELKALVKNVSVKSNSNSEYFEVTPVLTGGTTATLNPNGEVTVTVTIRLIKTPVSDDISTTATIEFDADPVAA